ncbi:MAG: type II toxin-antitoxin system VapC family toxin [Verrucomicrobiaceae bacterium]|nr:type II toxin-antitoxin system VapC family toxin [Verrucomicrobiaceae bacterium]
MILDTNALSALCAHDAAILQQLRRPETAQPWLCFVCLGEYRNGLLNSTRSEQPLATLEQLCSAWGTLHSDDVTVTHYAEIAHQLRVSGRPIPTNDIWIAALARQHAMPILSRDRHFDFVEGIRRLEW